jgi:1-deoxy-D-xylulose-5-phosphate reductoisomerase
MQRRVAVLGSTGSIGRQALEVIDGNPGLLLHSIVCGSSSDVLSMQRKRFQPSFSEVTSGMVAARVFAEAMEGADVVLNAIVGSPGLEASLIAQSRGKLLALANKESLVIGGELLKPHLNAGMIIPVDSEHSTIFRCIQGESRPVRKIVLTASGGSLRDLPPASIALASVEQVLRHPTWNMGGRITVDSATLVNKAFEVLEARALFPGVPVSAVIHRPSIVHSLVECADGAWKALMGFPDMKIPISWALLYPDLPTEALVMEDPTQWGTLSFEKLDPARYPAFGAVLDAGETGGTAPAAANAADEVAVAAFLSGRIPFGAIALVIRETLDSFESRPADSFLAVCEADSIARERARKAVDRICLQQFP